MNVGQGEVPIVRKEKGKGVVEPEVADEFKEDVEAMISSYKQIISDQQAMIERQDADIARLHRSLTDSVSHREAQHHRSETRITHLQTLLSEITQEMSTLKQTHATEIEAMRRAREEDKAKWEMRVMEEVRKAEAVTKEAERMAARSEELQRRIEEEGARMEEIQGRLGRRVEDLMRERDVLAEKCREMGETFDSTNATLRQDFATLQSQLQESQAESERAHDIVVATQKELEKARTEVARTREQVNGSMMEVETVKRELGKAIQSRDTLNEQFLATRRSLDTLRTTHDRTTHDHTALVRTLESTRLALAASERRTHEVEDESQKRGENIQTLTLRLQRIEKELEERVLQVEALTRDLGRVKGQAGEMERELQRRVEEARKVGEEVGRGREEKLLRRVAEMEGLVRELEGRNREWERRERERRGGMDRERMQTIVGVVKEDVQRMRELRDTVVGLERRVEGLMRPHGEDITFREVLGLIEESAHSTDALASALSTYRNHQTALEQQHAQQTAELEDQIAELS
ncbi:hypothetical protein HK102_003934, partial [Quaeritorhiza haematococci]